MIDFLGSDHAPHALEEKSYTYPNSPSGMPGVETALPLMLTQMQAGKCTLGQVLQWMCNGPAEAYRFPSKGRLLEGWDADLTLVDLGQVRTVRNENIHSKARWSPYQGWKLTGWPVYTVVGGRVVFDQGRIREGVRGQPLSFGQG